MGCADAHCPRAAFTDHEQLELMEMDWATAVIGIMALVLLSLPFVLDRRSRAKRGELVLRSMQVLAQQNGSTLELHESCGQTTFGVDTGKKFLLHANEQTGKMVLQHVDLTTVGACHVAKASRRVKGQNGQEVVERLELCLTPKDKSRSESRFELYREGLSPGLNGELQFAEKWAALINTRLKGR